MDSSSSNDSFAWSHVSNDSEDIGSESSCPMNNHNNKDSLKYEEDSCVQQKIKKRKLKAEPTDSENSIDSPKKKKIKLEKADDCSISKKKRKRNHKQSESVSIDYSEENILKDYDYLNIKVKQEQDNWEKATLSKEKKNKKIKNDTDKSLNELDHDFDSSDKKKKLKKNKANYLESDIPPDEETPVIRPKKQKSKTEAKSNENNDDNYIIEDKFSAEETEIQKIPAQSIPCVNGDVDDTIHDTESIKKYSDNESPSEDYTENYSTNIKSVHEKDTNCIVPKKRNDKQEMVCDNSFRGNSHSKLTNHETSRILDRIRFEDETDSDTDKSQKNMVKESSRLKTFLKANTTLQPVLEKLQRCQEITDSEEFWILKCPSEININDFKDRDLVLDSKSKIKLNGETYNGNLEEDIDRVTVMTADKDGFIIKHVKVNGIVTLRKRLPKPHVVEDNVMVNNQTDFIPLPDTKCRHPLFGSDYKNSLKLPISVAQRLINFNNISTSVNNDKKKRKKHKKEQNRESDLDDSHDIKPKIEMDTPTKKAKKRKHDRNDNDSETPVKKAKRIKREPDSSDVWDSEKAIEENLFNF